MSSMGYVIAAYVLGLGLMFGYAASIWFATRSLTKADTCRPSGAAGENGAVS